MSQLSYPFVCHYFVPFAPNRPPATPRPPDPSIKDVWNQLQCWLDPWNVEGVLFSKVTGYASN
jgi:hypothetical protein